MVGNGQCITCSCLCPNVPHFLPKPIFSHTLLHFPIKDVDIILGIEWLCSLGSLEADFSKLQHTFTFGNSIITIKGNPTAKPTSATFNQLCHYIAKDGIASFHLLSFESIDPNITLPPRPQK